MKFYIDEIESDEVCDKIFKTKGAKAIKQCHSSHNGIYNHGLSYAYSIMISYLFKKDILFITKLDRGYDFLEMVNHDEQMIDFIETKEFIMEDILHSLEKHATETITHYF